MRRPRSNRGRERASHHGIGGNLKRAGTFVNGYVRMRMPTEWYPVNRVVDEVTKVI